MAKWTSAAADSYAEAMRRRYGEVCVKPMVPVDNLEPLEECEVVFFEGKIVRVSEWRPSTLFDRTGEAAEALPDCVLDPIDEIQRVETKRPLFAHDPDEPERLRRVFATWDFRNGT